MSNAIDNGAGIAANAISHASFVTMQPEPSKFYALANGDTVGTSVEGKMLEQVRAIACLATRNAIIT